MGFLSVLSTAHKWIAERTIAGDIVIDATAGRGVDTLELARLTGATGTVYAFDIQQDALEQTSIRLSEATDHQQLAATNLILDSHANMAQHIESAMHGRVAAVMFNFGYLPGSDETIITEPDSSLQALEAALALLKKGGIITCVLYPGHAGGEQEACAVQQWAANLPAKAAQSVIYRQLQRDTAPYLIAIEKKQSD